MENGEDEILMLHLEDILVNYAKEVHQEIVDGICGRTEQRTAIRDLARHRVECEPVVIQKGGKNYLRVDHEKYLAQAMIDRLEAEITQLRNQFVALSSMGVLPGLASIRHNPGNTPD